jgi:integrase
MDFDAANGSVRFDRKGKDTNIGHVFLTEEGTAFFRELVAGRAPSELLFLRDDVERGTRKDLKNAEGWLKDDVKTPMRRACKAAQIEPLVFYELRHTYASSLIARGIPLLIVAQQLGHKSTRMVEEHYGHLAPNATKDTIRALAPTLGIAEPEKVAELKIQT